MPWCLPACRAAPLPLESRRCQPGLPGPHGAALAGALPRSRCSSRWLSLLPSIASLHPRGRVSAAETRGSQHVYQSLRCGGSKMASEKSSSFRIRSEQGSAYSPGDKEKAPLSVETPGGRGGNGVLRPPLPGVVPPARSRPEALW